MEGRAAVLGALAITLVISALFGLSILISILVRLPTSLALPVAVRAVGGPILLTGLVVAAWTFRYRSPEKMIVSTFVTFSKMLRQSPISAWSSRRESLVVVGPQRYVRHPLYLGVILVVLGWALLTASTIGVIMTAFILLWIRFVQIPFEERELRALFGEQYVKYCKEIPMLIPLPRRR